MSENSSGHARNYFQCFGNSPDKCQGKNGEDFYSCLHKQDEKCAKEYGLK